jgi:hypothetical protein
MPVQNDNGGSNGPWGSGSNPSTDIESLIRKGQSRLKGAMPGGGLRGILILVAVLLVGLALWTTYYTVPSYSVAVVQRFGKYVQNVPPGLHFKLPLGIDVATIVPVKRQLKQEFGLPCPTIEIVLEDRVDGCVGARADLDRPAAGRFEALGAMCLGKPDDADAGPEALFGMCLVAHDDVDEGFGRWADNHPFPQGGRMLRIRWPDQNGIGGRITPDSTAE